MEGRSRHCPHLGLKHTRSIRFSSPTPEHRCYIFGEPLPIQVDQRTYCLGERHPECPRFAGQEAPPTTATARAPRPRRRFGSGLAAFWQKLSSRDRVIYLSLIGFLILMLIAYGIIRGVVLPGQQGGASTPVASKTAKATRTPMAVVTPAVTGPPSVRTAVPTAVAVPTQLPLSTRTPLPPSATALLPTKTPVPSTVTPIVVVPTSVPTPVGPTVAPATPTPGVTWSKLYFLASNKAFYVPVTRQGSFTLGVARRVIEEMIAGPRAGSNLTRSIPAGMALKNIYIEGGTCYVDFDHRFEDLGAGQMEAMAVIWALTEFQTIQRVQLMVNGTQVGLPGSADSGPVARPGYVNFENPYGLEAKDAVALTLYFATADGQHLFPVVRYVPSTVGVARAAIEEMVKGPTAAYQGAAISPLPSGVQIRDIRREGDTIVVDFNSTLLQAANADLAVQALRLAMTDLTADNPMGVRAVRISVEGTDLGVYWGSVYSGDLGRPLLNPE